MYESRHYDGLLSSPPYSATSQSFNLQRSVHSPQSHYVPSKAPAYSHYAEETPQHFYQWFSPPGFVKIFHGATVLMSFIIFACVASTLVWDFNGFGYGIGSGTGSGQGYYGGSYGYSSSYMTPQSAKAAMISMASINFVVFLGFLVGSFSRSRAMRGSTLYLTFFICDTILAILQAIIDIIFVIGVNPMSQSSQSMLYNPILMMCQNIPDRPSFSGSVGSGFPGGFPMYNQLLYHYCFMDPEEAVAFALGLMVVLALSFAAYYSWKTRSKIWHHGKDNIYWDQPMVSLSERHNVQEWVNNVGEGHSTQHASTIVISEKAASDLRGGNNAVSHSHKNVLAHSEGLLNNSKLQEIAHPYSNNSPAVCSIPSGYAESQGKLNTRGQGNPKYHTRATMESQNEMAYTTGGDTANELDDDQAQYLFSQYTEILSDEQRREYKQDFQSALTRYKSLCKEMDEICDHIRMLSQELDTLDKNSIKYQGVVDEYNRLKDLKRAPEYQAKKKESKELRKKMFHIKKLIKNFDRGLC
ncbi:occludin-like [Stigmatopora nigra]